MKEYEQMITRQRKWMLYLLAILVLGAAFTPYTTIFLGLLLGSSASFYNLFLLQKKINDYVESVAKKQSAKGIGMISRFAMAILAMLIAIRYDEYFNVIAVLIGLMTSYIVIVIDYLTARKG